MIAMKTLKNGRSLACSTSYVSFNLKLEQWVNRHYSTGEKLTVCVYYWSDTEREKVEQGLMKPQLPWRAFVLTKTKPSFVVKNEHHAGLLFHMYLDAPLRQFELVYFCCRALRGLFLLSLSCVVQLFLLNYEGLVTILS